MVALSRELGVQFARKGIRVNALCPGPVHTPLLRELHGVDVSGRRRHLRCLRHTQPAGQAGHSSGPLPACPRFNLGMPRRIGDIWVRWIPAACAGIAGLVVLISTGCAAAGPETASPPQLSNTSSAPLPSAPTTSAVAQPTAKDGTNLQACSSGYCEVQVRAQDKIPLKPGLGINSLQVESILEGTITFLSTFRNSISGSCSGAERCSSESSVGSGRMGTGRHQASAGATLTLNQLRIDVVAVTGEFAIIRLAPA